MRTGERTGPAVTTFGCAVVFVRVRTQSNDAPSGEVHAGVESPLLEAAEAGAAEVEAGRHELHVPLLQDVVYHLRRGTIGSVRIQSIWGGREGDRPDKRRAVGSSTQDPAFYIHFRPVLEGTQGNGTCPCRTAGHWFCDPPRST